MRLVWHEGWCQRHESLLHTAIAGRDKKSYLLITVTRPTLVSPAIRLSLGSNTQ
jgi:hypothetical protein